MAEWVPRLRRLPLVGMAFNPSSGQCQNSLWPSDPMRVPVRSVAITFYESRGIASRSSSHSSTTRPSGR